MRAPTRSSRSVPGRVLRHTITFSGIGACSSPCVRRYSAARLLTCSAVMRSDSSRSMFRLPLRKKLASDCSTFSGA